MNDDDFFGVPVKKHNELDEVIVPASISPKANAQEKAPPIPVVAASVAAPPAAAAVASGPAQLYQEQLKAVADRTSQGDQATREREERQRKQAQAYLAEQIALRESRVKVIKTDHVKQQAEHEQKLQDLKKSGAVWQSVGLLVDLAKPSAHSRHTEQMRSILKKLSQQ